MKNKENEIYFKKIEEIKPKVYQFYELSNRKDLIMVYEMKEDRIYSYTYKEFHASLNVRSQIMLEIQYKEAQDINGIVLFIRDSQRKKFKSFVI